MLIKLGNIAVSGELPSFKNGRSFCFAIIVASVAMFGMVVFSAASLRAEPPRTTYGRIVVPNSLRSSQAQLSQPELRLNSRSYNGNQAVFTDEFGYQSTPSSGGALAYRNSHPSQRFGQQPLRRSYERLGRNRVMAATFQESIDTGNAPTASEPLLPPANLDSSVPSDAVAGGNAVMMHDDPYEHAVSMQGYEHANSDMYCDGCYNAECDCGFADCRRDAMYQCRLRIGLGVIGFGNALNYAGAGANPWSGDGTGSFGFQESLQWSTEVPGLFRGEMGAQVGVRTVQANLSGAEFTADGRNQLYVTAGLFRRADYGLQGGLVIDYLAERWYLNTDLVQLRGELSYMFEPCHELGFRFTSGMQSSSSGGFILNDAGALASTSGVFSAVDQYRFFTRHVLNQRTNSYLEISAGWSDEKHGIISALFETAITSQVSCQSSFAMGLPGDAVSEANHQQEFWQMGLMLVWTPSTPALSGLQDYYRPLFEIADPGSFFVGPTH